MTTPLPTEWQQIDDLDAVHDKQLPLTLEYADRSPFYRRRWGNHPARSRAELAALPLTTKADLRENYPFGMLAVAPQRLATYHESSGTGGIPTPSYYTEQDWEDLDERFGRKWIGIGAADVFLVRTPYALMITGHLAQSAARRRGATVVPADNRSLAMPYSRVVRVLHDLGVTLSWSLPTEPLLWAAAARAAGHDPGRAFPNLRALFVAGEPLSAARRRRIQQIWGAPAIEEYGSTETGPLAGACPFGRLHLWADRVIAEVHDPRTGRTSREGTGQLVVSLLDREAMPLLRYNLEDDVSISYQPCPCDWRLPTVEVLGRTAFGYRIGAACVTQARLEEVVFSLPLQYGVMFWRAKAHPDRLRVEVEVDPRYRDEACGALESALRAAYAIPVEIVGVGPGGLVPREVLTGRSDVVKPRSLFGPDEEWDRALLYY